MPHPRRTWQVSDRPTLQTAADAPAILEALARATWAKARDGAECPPDQIPTYADLAGHSFPFATVQEAVAASSAAVGGAPLSLDTINPARTDGAPAPLVPGGFALYWAWLPVSTGRPDLAAGARSGAHRKHNRGRARALAHDAGAAPRVTRWRRWWPRGNGAT